MNCIICGSDNIRMVDTIISDFVMARIDPSYEKHKRNIKTKLCFCENCTFAFYQYRLSDKQEELLYNNYRDDKYQKTREKYECWYTKKVNDSLNHGDCVQAQKIRIRELLSAHAMDKPQCVLDYGGNEGTSFYDELGTKEKFIFDISGVKPLPGITAIKTCRELFSHSYDFIMCNMVFEHLSDPNSLLKTLNEIGNSGTAYYIEVPSENPFISSNKFSIRNNISLLFDPNYNWIKLAKYYFQQRKQPFMPMKEHVNFFTQKSIDVMVCNSGFSVIDIREFKEKNTKVLSILFTKK